MAKGNTVGQGQFRQPMSGRRGLTGSSMRETGSSRDNDLLSSIRNIAGNLGGQTRTVNTGPNTTMPVLPPELPPLIPPSMPSNPYGTSLMIGNPYNNFMGGMFSPWQNPMGMPNFPFTPNQRPPTELPPPTPAPTPPPPPPAPRLFGQNEANQKLRSHLNRNLNDEEMNLLFGQIGRKDQYSEDEIMRAVGLVRQYKPDAIAQPNTPTPTSQPTPSPTPSPVPPPTPQPTRYSGQEALGRLGLRGALSGDETNLLLSQFGGKTEFDDADIERAKGLVRQYRPDLL